MEWLKYALQGLSLFLIMFGLASLALAWLAPRSLDGRLMTGMLTGERLAPSRRNRGLVCLGSILFGLYAWLIVTGHPLPAMVALAAWLPITWFLYRARTRPSAA